MDIGRGQYQVHPEDLVGNEPFSIGFCYILLCYDYDFRIFYVFGLRDVAQSVPFIS